MLRPTINLCVVLRLYFPFQVIVVDWNAESVPAHRDNALLLPKWDGDNTDRNLIGLAQLLQGIVCSCHVVCTKPEQFYFLYFVTHDGLAHGVFVDYSRSHAPLSTPLLTLHQFLLNSFFSHKAGKRGGCSRGARIL